jgi:hypothetical protein
VLLLKRGFGLVGCFEKFAVELFELLAYPFSGNAYSIGTTRGTNHAKGEALLMVADRQCHQKAVALDLVVPDAAASARFATPAKLLANVIEGVYQAADSGD